MNLIKYAPMLIVPAIGARRLLASSPPAASSLLPTPASTPPLLSTTHQSPPPWETSASSASSLLPTPTTISADCYPQSVGNGSIVPEPQTNLTNCIEMIPGQQYPRLCTDDNANITVTPLSPFGVNDGSARFTVSTTNGTYCNPGIVFDNLGPSILQVCADGSGNGTDKAPNVISGKDDGNGKVVVSIYNAPDSGKKEACDEIVAENATETTCYDTSQGGQSAVVFADTTEPQPLYCGTTASPPGPTETQNSTQTGSQNSDFTPAQWGEVAAGVVGCCMAIGAVIVRLTPEYWNPVKKFATGRTVPRNLNSDTIPPLSQEHGHAIYQEMMDGTPISGDFASNELNLDYPLLARLPGDSILHRRLVKIHGDNVPDYFRAEMGRMPPGFFHRVEAGSIVGQQSVAGQPPLPFTLIRPPQELQEIAPTAPEIPSVADTEGISVGGSPSNKITSTPANVVENTFPSDFNGIVNMTHDPEYDEGFGGYIISDINFSRTLSSRDAKLLHAVNKTEATDIKLTDVEQYYAANLGTRRDHIKNLQRFVKNNSEVSMTMHGGIITGIVPASSKDIELNKPLSKSDSAEHSLPTGALAVEPRFLSSRLQRPSSVPSNLNLLAGLNHDARAASGRLRSPSVHSRT